MKRKRQEEEEDGVLRHPVALFDFPNLLPELRTEVRSHMTSLTRHVLRLTSRDMVKDDRAPPATPYFLTCLRQWLDHVPWMRSVLRTWRFFTDWERELGAATLLGGEVRTECLVAWRVSEMLLIKVCCIDGLFWRIELCIRRDMDSWFHVVRAYAYALDGQMEALRLTIRDWLDAGCVWPEGLTTCPRLDA